MIFESLVIHNFGLYAGRQEIALAPTRREKPIVLFGGLNGAGKTTLLDALQLVLYGKMANPATRDGKSYHDYLKECVHRGVGLSEGASVELWFSHRAGGATDSYRVCRTWAANNGSFRERVSVLKNGRIDDALTENWPQYVEGLIPCNIAQLFFFDGEKIAELAEETSTRTFLSTAVRSLLGLDVISQLSMDLEVIVRRQQKDVGSENIKAEIQGEEAHLEEVERGYRQLVDACATCKNDMEQLNKKALKLEKDFRSSGGDIYQNRAALQARLEERRKAQKALEARMRSFAEGAAPLSAARGVFAALVKQMAMELENKRGQVVLDAVAERDKKTMQLARNIAIPTRMIEELGDLLSDDLARQRSTLCDGDGHYLQLNERASDEIRLVDAAVEGLITEARELVKQWRSLSAEADDVERALQTVPPDEAVGSLVEGLEQARREAAKQEALLSVLEEQKHEAFKVVETQKRKLLAAIEKAVDGELQHEHAQRVVVRSQKSRNLLEKFAGRLLETHVIRLQNLILDSFRQLLRKERLVTAVAIDPGTFEMSLQGANGDALPIERLSAGERQLLAVAMLWGLARASGRAVPCVIDTPLGRLDSTHRDNLINIYFPRASHQVLLLSTDEEIDRARAEQLSAHVGRSYLLDYDDKKRVTHVKDGYFWRGS